MDAVVQVGQREQSAGIKVFDRLRLVVYRLKMRAELLVFPQALQNNQRTSIAYQVCAQP